MGMGTRAAEQPAGSAVMADDRFVDWIVRDTHWSRAGLPLAMVLLLIAPVVRRGMGRAPFLVYLQLPVYMLHQYEEHAHGAFKADANRSLRPRGRRLTDRKIFWVNILGVWGVDVCALYLARYTKPANGLVAPYLAVVNGLAHTGRAIKERRYNPGLWTSLLLLLPIGSSSAYAIARISPAARGAQVRGLGASILLHVLVAFSILQGGRERPSGGD